MTQPEKLLEYIVSSPAIIVAYLASIVVGLGLAAHRAYLVYLGIDPDAIDSSAATLAFTYISFGLKVLSRYWMAVAVGGFFLAVLVAMTCLISADNGAIAAHQQSTRNRIHRTDSSVFVSAWAVFCLVLIVVGVPYSYFKIDGVGASAGEHFALGYLKDPFKYFRPVEFRIRAIPSSTAALKGNQLENKFESGITSVPENDPEGIVGNDSCLRLILMDKKSVYIYKAYEETLGGVPEIFVIPQDRIEYLKIFPARRKLCSASGS